MAYADSFSISLPRFTSRLARLGVRARAWLALAGAGVLLAGCMSGPPPRIETGPSATTPPTSPIQKGRLQAASWNEIGGWGQDDVRAAWPALQAPNVPISPGADYLDVQLFFNPTAPGVFEGQVFFRTDDLFNPERVVRVRGEAYDAGTCVGRIVPVPQLDFGKVPPGEWAILGFRFEPAPPAAAAALRAPAGTEVLHVERLNLADDRPFARVDVWVRGDLGAELSRAEVEHAPFYDLLPLRGVALGTVQQTIGAEVADAASARLLDTDTGAPLLLARRCTYDTDGAPVLYSEHRYPADRTTLEIEFSLNVGVHEHV